MKKIIISLLLLCNIKSYAQENCTIFLENIGKLLKSSTRIEGKIKEELIIQTKYFIACKGEIVGMNNPVIKNLEKLSYITPFYKGRAIATTKDNLDVIIDDNFAIVKTLEFTTVRSGFSFGLAQVNKRAAKITLNDKWGYINTNGDVVIPIIYYDVWGFIEGISKVKSKFNGGYGYIDTTGKEIIPAKFKYAWNLNDNGGMIIVYKKNALNGYPKDYGMFDKKGNEILKPIYDNIYYSYKEGGLYFVQLKGKKYFVNKKGEFVKDSE